MVEQGKQVVASLIFFLSILPFLSSVSMLLPEASKWLREARMLGPVHT